MSSVRTPNLIRSIKMFIMDEDNVKWYNEHGIKVRETKGSTCDDIDCTNCKNLYQVEASGGICKIKQIQVCNDNYCNLFESE